MAEINIAQRHKARILVMQGLYQWHMTHEAIPVIEEQFRRFNKMETVDEHYYQELLYQIPKNVAELDALFTPLLDRDISDLNPIELSIIRMASYELAHRLEIPYKVVINEACELAKQFGATDSYKYVNAVLDKLALQIRIHEDRG